MVEVMGKLLTDDDIRADTAIKEVIGKTPQKFLQIGGEKTQIGENFGADLEMDAHPPGQGISGGQDKHKNNGQNDKHNPPGGRKKETSVSSYSIAKGG